MDGYARIASVFHQRIDNIAGAVDSMAPALEEASNALLHAVLSDRRIIVLACGVDFALGAHVAAELRTPRGTGPALPAIHLGSSCAGAATPEGAESVPLWRDLRTLSRDGDAIICIDTTPGATVAQLAVHLAGQRNLVPVTLSESSELQGCSVALPGDTPALRSELALMAMHCLQELIGQAMLGE
ncbi:MAG: D-sedoheptulose 7-phosphate isomerase [Halieaceae bacterium]|jgi:D-sedoheptulose 7-phosphate isomerase